MKKIRFLLLSLLAFPLFLSGMTVFADIIPVSPAKVDLEKDLQDLKDFNDRENERRKNAETQEQKTAVNCSADKMINGICRMDVYNMLGIRG